MPVENNHKRAKLIVIGGGFAGLHVIQKLKNAPVDITLIDKKNHHVFQPLLYQAATATVSISDISSSFRYLFRKHKNTKTLMGEVVHISPDEKIVTLKNGDTYPFDYLVVATGARHSYFGNDQWEAIAPGIKTTEDALKIREKIFMALEEAERINNPSLTQKYLNFVIIGGGPTGVEFAGTIGELVHRTLKKNFRNIDINNTRIYLIEGLDRILPPFDPKLSAVTQKALEKMGVTVLTNTFVTNITENGVAIKDDFIEAKTIIWAAGNSASPLLQHLNCELDKQGRAIVTANLSLPNNPHIFVLGDASHFKDKQGNPLPAVATYALQQGDFVGKFLRDEFNSSNKHRSAKFKPFNKGNLATIGTGKAVAEIWGTKFSGFTAWLIWAFVHILYLVGFRNRISVLLQWCSNFLTGARTSRIVHGSVDDKLQKDQASH